MEPVSIPTGTAVHSARAADRGRGHRGVRRSSSAEKGLGATARFVFISLHEPPKDALAAGGRAPCRARRTSSSTRRPSGRPTRRSSRSTDRAVVSLRGTSRACRRRSWPRSSWPARRSCRPTRAGRRRMRKRGVEDFSLAMIDPWASSYTGPDDDPSERRICRPLTWVRSEPGEHGYARPVEGLVARSTSTRMEVVDVADHGVVPLRRSARQLRGAVDLRGRQRPVVRAVPRRPQADRDHAARGPQLHGRRPRRAAGRSGTLRIGFTPREGLVLHQVGYDDRGTLRPIIHRASLAEMYVPVRRPGAHAPVQERVRPGRVRRRLAGEPADARLRLRRAHPLLRRRRQRPGRRPRHDPERDLHARGGRGHRRGSTPTSAPRRWRCGGCGGSSSRRSPPSATTSTGTSGTSTPTARSSTRSSSPACISTGALNVGETPEHGTLVAPACTRRTISTSSACGWTWRSTAR